MRYRTCFVLAATALAAATAAQAGHRDQGQGKAQAAAERDALAQGGAGRVTGKHARRRRPCERRGT